MLAVTGAVDTGIGNEKRFWIDLGGEVCKRRVRVFELDYNICGK